MAGAGMRERVERPPGGLPGQDANVGNATSSGPSAGSYSMTGGRIGAAQAQCRAVQSAS